MGQTAYAEMEARPRDKLTGFWRRIADAIVEGATTRREVVDAVVDRRTKPGNVDSAMRQMSLAGLLCKTERTWSLTERALSQMSGE